MSTQTGASAVKLGGSIVWSVQIRALACSLLAQSFLSAAPALAQSDFSTAGASQVSIGLGNTAPTGRSFEPVSPPNGNFLVFASTADNLVNNDTNGSSDIFAYAPGKPIELLSVVPTTGQFPNGSSVGPAVSPVLPDGSYAVAFVSNATNIVPGVTAPPGANNPNQVYIRLPTTNETLLLSGGLTTSGTVGQLGANAPCDQVSITAIPNPNRFIVTFRSKAGNLEFPPSSSQLQYKTIFVTTLTTVNGKTIISSPPQAARNSDGSPYRGDLNGPSISGDGRWIAFNSSAPIVGPSNGFQQVYLYNRATREIRVITRTPQGELGNADSRGTSVSFQGEKVAFITGATNLLAGANASRKAYQFELSTRTFLHINRASGGEVSNGDAFWIRMSPNGRLAVFSDNGTNLVVDGATNSRVQTYIKDTVTGSIIRASVTSTNAAADGDSGGSDFDERGDDTRPALAIGSAGFTSRAIFADFRSAAQNLTSVGVSSESLTNIFRSTVTPPKPKLTKNAPIEAPPDVTIDKTLPNGKGARVTIFLQEFDDITASATADESSAEIGSLATKIKYRLEIRKIGSRQQIIRTLTRNRVTISRLSPGKYNIRYRVTKTSGRTVIRSGYSATQSLDIS